jgi:hypothetical protein
MSGAKEAKLKEVVEHHLPHEIDMLFGLFMRLSEGITDIHLRNAAMGSFCIHARNLIEFLESVGQGVKAKAVTHDYKAFAGGKIDKTLKDKIQNQIVHLGFGRTMDREQLINRDGCIALARAITTELLIVQRHWRPEYVPTWEIERAGDTVVFKRQPKKDWGGFHEG